MAPVRNLLAASPTHIVGTLMQWPHSPYTVPLDSRKTHANHLWSHPTQAGGWADST